MLKENFSSNKFSPIFEPLTIGDGQLMIQEQVLRCTIGPTNAQTYHDAQIYDYGHLRRAQYPWRPPLQMTVRAWASHSTEQLQGTAGFGFWNQPLMPGQRFPRIPRAVWFFFSSPPNNMHLAKGVPGYGWKAATFDARQLQFWGLLPLAPLGLAAMRLPVLYNSLWPIGQRAIGVSEKLLPVDIAEPHTYRLIWRKTNAEFWVDNERVHFAPTAPKGPLGFIAWLDNQYAVVTPQGHFAFGYIAVQEPQWLAIDSIEIETLET